jgi:hypothetical protein
MGGKGASWPGLGALLAAALAAAACGGGGHLTASVLSCSGPVTVSDRTAAAMVAAARGALPLGEGERLVIYTPFVMGEAGGRAVLEEVALVERPDGSRELRQAQVVLEQDGQGYRLLERRPMQARPYRGEGCPLEGVAAPRGDEAAGGGCEDGSHTFAAMVVAQRLDAPQAPLPAPEGARIEEAYQRYWCITSAAYRSLRQEGLEQVAAGDELLRLRWELAGRAGAGAALEERVRHLRVTLLQYTGRTAVVDGWAVLSYRSGDSGSWSGEEQALFSLHLARGDDGVWRVDRVRRLPTAREAP